MGLAYEIMFGFLTLVNENGHVTSEREVQLVGSVKSWLFFSISR